MTDSKTILRKKNQVGRFTVSDFKIYCKEILVKIVWHQHKGRNTDKWNRESRVHSFIHSPLILISVPRFSMEKDNLYQQMVLWQLNEYMQKNKVFFSLHIIFKNKLKNGSNIVSHIKLFRIKTRTNIFFLKFGNGFFKMTSKTTSKNEKLVSGTSWQLKTVLHQGTILRKWKFTPKFANYLSTERHLEYLKTVATQ